MAKHKVNSCGKPRNIQAFPQFQPQLCLQFEQPITSREIETNPLMHATLQWPKQTGNQNYFEGGGRAGPHEKSMYRAIISRSRNRGGSRRPLQGFGD